MTIREFGSSKPDSLFIKDIINNYNLNIQFYLKMFDVVFPNIEFKKKTDFSSVIVYSAKYRRHVFELYVSVNSVDRLTLNHVFYFDDVKWIEIVNTNLNKDICDDTVKFNTLQTMDKIKFLANCNLIEPNIVDFLLN